MKEMVLNSIGSVDTITLILDSSVFCCISPCQEDFVPDYAISDIMMDLSSIDKFKAEAILHSKFSTLMAKR